MRTLLVLFSLILTFNLKAFTQLNDTSNIIFDYIQIPATFPGGPDAIWCFLESKFKYDVLNSDQKIVTYFFRFVVDSSGIARDFKFMNTRPRDITLERTDSLKITEILRVLALMPKWEPARQPDNKLNTWIVLPIKTPYTDFRCKQKTNNSH